VGAPEIHHGWNRLVSKKLTAPGRIIKVFKNFDSTAKAHFRNLDQFGKCARLMIQPHEHSKKALSE